MQRRVFPEAGWETRSRSNVSPDFSRNLERFGEFLAVGLLSLTGKEGGTLGGGGLQAVPARHEHDDLGRCRLDPPPTRLGQTAHRGWGVGRTPGGLDHLGLRWGELNGGSDHSTAKVPGLCLPATAWVTASATCDGVRRRGPLLRPRSRSRRQPEGGIRAVPRRANSGPWREPRSDNRAARVPSSHGRKARRTPHTSWVSTRSG